MCGDGVFLLDIDDDILFVRLNVGEDWLVACIFKAKAAAVASRKLADLG